MNSIDIHIGDRTQPIDIDIGSSKQNIDMNIPNTQTNSDIHIDNETQPINIGMGCPNRPTDMDMIEIPPGSETEFVMRKDVESELDENSTNPVQNKTITLIINQLIQQIGHIPKIYFDTKENWASQTSLVSEKDAIYVYTNNHVDSQGNLNASAKIGDGLAYVVDLPFVDSGIWEHIYDTAIHITNAERLFWNNKVRCFYSEVQKNNLVFTTE